MPIEVGPLRAIGAIENRLARKAGEGSEPSVRAARAQPAVVQSEALDTGDMPVDFERVQLIRKAVESGTYPLLPARVADAMIAAEMILRSGK